jgi:hypothetical protein
MSNDEKANPMELINFSTNQRVYDGMIDCNKLPSSCLLCSEGKLEEFGHILPKFVMRWLKRASKKNEFYLNNTKQKVPDTLALKILCKNCEDLFSKYEKSFTDQHFKKHYRKELPAAINDDIYFFALSIAWRIMASTPIMRGQEDGEKYYREFRDVVKSYLLKPDESAEIDVYTFRANEIVINLPEQHYKPNILNFSVVQNIFVRNLIYDKINCRATLFPIPLVYFKLGVYYFIVGYRNYLQNLTFPKKMEATEGGRVYILKYTYELMGFLNCISNWDFYEVDKSIIPLNIEYNKTRLPF